jgi:hypothetical protein
MNSPTSILEATVASGMRPVCNIAVGPFQEDRPWFVLMDGEGLGHTAESVLSVPTSDIRTRTPYCSSTMPADPQGFVQLRIPAQTYAVFQHRPRPRPPCSRNVSECTCARVGLIPTGDDVYREQYISWEVVSVENDGLLAPPCSFLVGFVFR